LDGDRRQLGHVWCAGWLSGLSLSARREHPGQRQGENGGKNRMFCAEPDRVFSDGRWASHREAPENGWEINKNLSYIENATNSQLILIVEMIGRTRRNKNGPARGPSKAHAECADQCAALYA